MGGSAPFTASPTVVIHSFPTWLPQTQPWIHTQIVSLPARIQPHVVCTRTENIEQFPVANLHVASPRAFDVLLPRRWRRTRVGFLADRIRRTGARILHSHFGDVAWEDSGAVALTGARHVIAFYGHDATALVQQAHVWRARYSELFRKAAWVLCEGPAMRRRIAELECPESSLRIHHLGVPVERIRFRPRSWDGQGQLRVLIAGSFREKKGIPIALESLMRVRHRLPLAVTVLGDAGPQPRSQAEKVRILETIERGGLGPIVSLRGACRYDQLLEEAYQHHVFLAASVTGADGDTEGGIPVVLLDVAATGMPIVATRHADIPELVEHGVTGLLVEERDVGALAASLIWLADNPRSWARLGTAARGRVEAEFAAVRQGERLAAIYDEL